MILSFSAKVYKLGINPCVDVPHDVLSKLQKQAGKTRGPISVRGKINGMEFRQTVVKYQGAWKLYLNTYMRQDAKVDVGDNVKIELEFDPNPRIVPVPDTLARALNKNKTAKAAWDKLPPSHRKEILSYLNSLKSKEALERNVQKVIRENLKF